MDFELVDEPVPAAEVARLTFVPFFPDGSCAVVRSAGGGFELPTGEVLTGEDYLLDSALRIPLETAGFRRQTFHAFARRGTHVYAWCEGARYRVNRPHADVPLEIGPPGDVALRLRAGGATEIAEIVEAATRSFQSIDAESLHAEHNRLLERAYLGATTLEGGSGFGGTPEEWRAGREPITDAIDASGTFLDIGCANGLLMESVRTWCGERGIDVEPYGLDVAPGLVARARERLPQWADRIWLGDASTWAHPHGMRFDFVHTLLDVVPRRRRADLISHVSHAIVRPGGRVLVSYYVRSAEHDRSAAEQLEDLGFDVAGRIAPTRRRTRLATTDRMAGRAVTNWAPPIPKVTALITRPGAGGPELLVFDHGLAGIQLPAGTVDEGESFATAALREGWEETGALGLELVRELAVTHHKFGGRTGAVVRDVVGDGRVYQRGNHLRVLRVDGAQAVSDLWDGTPIELATNLIARSEERHLFHLRATVEMPDEWFVVTPDGGGTDWWCFWVPLDDAHALLHEYQRDWLDAAGRQLEESAQKAPPTRARSPLPVEFHDATVWEQFVAPPVDRRFALSFFDDCDEEACSRAHGLCVTEDGQVVLIKESNGYWDLPGGGKERGESTAENFAREIWEEVCARVVDSRFLTALGLVELDRHGAPIGPVEHHAQMWARVELEEWAPQFEITERLLVTPDDAIVLSLHSRTTRALLDRAATVDPRLTWEPDAE